MNSLLQALTRADPVTGRPPARRVYSYVLYPLVANTLIAAMFWRFLPNSGTFGENLLYSQCIGCLIALAIFVPRILLWRNCPVQPIPMLLIIAFAIPFGLGMGTWIAATLLGHRIWFFSSVQRDVLMVPILTTTVVAAVTASAFFWTRERVIALRLQAETERLRAEAASRMASEAQLKMIRAQLEPHMLFNTLANLRALMGVDPQKAQAMLDRLIAWLRATLSASRAERVTLAAEFELVEDYLELIAIRMGSRLKYSLDLPAELKTVKVLPMLLQPLVENAIKHGLEPSVGGGRVDVRAAHRQGALTLTVSDTGQGFPIRHDETPVTGRAGDSEIGFGLPQVRARLKTAYGDAASLTIESPRSDTGSGSRLQLTIPSMSP
jgi:sensor histidine kinase YesM